jgi:Flp pilus assembly protein TadD
MLAPVSDSDALLPMVQLRRAALLASIKEPSAALKILDSLNATFPDRPEPYSMRGDIEHDAKHYTASVNAYTAAIARLGHETQQNWTLFYQRGISQERAGDWPKAEADFQHALQLAPEQPFVLNYLAYSWTERGENLDKARQMIERAVALRPNDGAIIDSLGWLVLRQGDVPGAVKLLQRAVELEPADPTVNGHLGDAYWAAGRKLEAQFQWRRALTLEPDADDVVKLQTKLRKSEDALGNVAAVPVATKAATP